MKNKEHQKGGFERRTENTIQLLLSPN